MAVDKNEQVFTKFSSLQRQASRLYTEAALGEASRDITETSTDMAKLPGELQRLRQRNYVFASYLERKIQTLETQWGGVRQEALRAIDSEAMRLRIESNQVSMLLDSASQQSGNAYALAAVLPNLERELNDLERKISSAEMRVKSRYMGTERDVNQTIEQLQQLHWMLDQRDEASFQFLAAENVFLTAEAEWVETGSGRKDPDGILYLTDQRLLFEQKEKTGKTLGLFGGKHTQELEWQIPLHQIENAQAENKGLFGGKDMLHFTLTSDAPYPRITAEVKGKAKCKFWAAQIERMIRGETKDERAIQPDPELLEAIRSAPTGCHVCGATLPQLTAGQMQIDCRYCGSVIRL